MRNDRRDLLAILAMGFLTLAPTSSLADSVNGKAKDANVKEIVDQLSSDDGQRRVEATKALFDEGKDALDWLRKSGAKQIAPVGTIKTRRLDIVYSVLAGFGKNPADGLSGYMTDSFGLHLEKGVTRADVIKMGRKHGFTLTDSLTPAGRPTCYVTLTKGKNLNAVIKSVLVSEPTVVSINLSYFEA